MLGYPPDEDRRVVVGAGHILKYSSDSSPRFLVWSAALSLPGRLDAMEHMNVESFNLDHTKVKAPFLRLAGRKAVPGGGEVVKYDLRFCQPNVDHLDMATAHSLEHMFAEFARNHSADVVDFSPMGCQTGFYLTLDRDVPYEEVLDLVEATLRDIVAADAVPAANEVQCGWGANHSLEGAQQASRDFLARRDEWAQVMA